MSLPVTTPGCPQCGQNQATKLGFTWWGGAIGPRILNHVQCLQCRKKYNGKSGQDNTPGIIIYSVVVGAIAFAVCFWLFSTM